jgi:uncharacterized membrane protein
MIPGVYELILWIPALCIPPVAVFYDAKKNDKNPYLWSIAILAGLTMNYLVGLVLVVVYLVYRTDNSVSDNEMDMREEFLNLLDPNERKVVECLLNHGEMNQSEIAKRTNLSHATVSRILTNLESKNIVTRQRDGMQKVVRLREEIMSKLQ